MTIRKSVVSYIMILVLLFHGCAVKQKTPEIGSEVWETMPEPTFGVLESEKLTVQPWNSGRAETMSHFAMAETKNGYYYTSSLTGILFFAEKDALDTWIPVCNKPDCSHQPDDRSCSAAISSNEIVIKDGRIFFTESLSRFPHLHNETGTTKAIMSMLPDGSDIRIDYYPEEALIFDGGSINSMLSAKYWLLLSTKIDEKGNRTVKLFRTDAAGTQKLDEMEEDANAPTSGISSASHSLGINGVELYRCSILGESGYYNFDEAVPQLVTLPDVSLMGAYYAGNTLRYFKQNVGYFDIRLDTGEEVFLTETRLQNSIAAVLLPNLIIESTLLSSLSIKTRIPGMEHFMEVFDGQQWHSVKLPEDIHYASMGTFFYLFGVTSDAIWLTQLQSETVRVNGTNQQYWDSHLYRIDLDADEWTLEYCGTIQQPRLSD